MRPTMPDLSRPSISRPSSKYHVLKARQYMPVDVIFLPLAVISAGRRPPPLEPMHFGAVINVADARLLSLSGFITDTEVQQEHGRITLRGMAAGPQVNTLSSTVDSMLECRAPIVALPSFISLVHVIIVHGTLDGTGRPVDWLAPGRGLPSRMRCKAWHGAQPRVRRLERLIFVG